MNLTELGFHKCASSRTVPNDLGNFLTKKTVQREAAEWASRKPQLKSIGDPARLGYKNPSPVKKPGSLMGRIIPDGVKNVLKNVLRKGR